MNYEKEYKKLKADIKKAYLFAQTNSTKAVLENILPELRESEDERIRKSLRSYLRGLGEFEYPDKETYNNWLAWLEKQREPQNEVRYWTEEEIEPIISDYLRGTEHYGGMIARLRCLKPKSLEKQEEPIDKEKVLIGARKDVAFSIMDFLDRNTLGMCLSNMECEDLVDAIVNSKWDKVYNYMKKKLEKQEEPNPYTGVSFKYNGHTWGMCARDGGVEILVDGEIKERVFLFDRPQGKSALEAAKEEKVDNQNCAKLADNYKPKFHEGDWISGYYTNYRVTAINSKGYVVEDTDGNKINILFENEKFHHLFTIADAKNGDVLVTEEDGKPFIFRDCPDTNNPNALVAYCGIDCTNCLTISTDDQWWTDEKVCPATKGQRLLLFSKMKEAGYEWDEKKKELKKLTQQEVTKISDKVKDSDWSEEDEKQLRDIVELLPNLTNRHAWLMSLKQRIGG